MSSNPILEKSVKFAERIVKLDKYLKDKNEFVLSNQILKSGTSIGANVTESTRAQSKADFHTKMTIALKEADETKYWLGLLKAGEYIDDKAFDSLNDDCEEIIKLLVAITKSSGNRQL
ncbi:MAG: four helix bundle protein [Clostridia bacterium]|nr:four helix bundle protein [Clostridia bacterium]